MACVLQSTTIVIWELVLCTINVWWKSDLCFTYTPVHFSLPCFTTLSGHYRGWRKKGGGTNSDYYYYENQPLCLSVSPAKIDLVRYLTRLVSFHFRDGFQILSNLEAWLLKYYEIFPTSFNQVSQHMLHSETRLYLSLTSNKCIRRFEWSYFAFFAFSLRVKRKRVTKIPAFPQIQFQTSKTFYEEYSKESAFERTLECQKGSIFPV